MIVAAGEALVDLVPEPFPGGGPMNVAIAAARLGAPTAFLGRVSTDEYGDMIWEHLEQSGVDLRVAERGGEPTCRAVVEGDPPTFHFYGEGTADRMLSSVDLTPLGPGPHIVHGGTLGMFRPPAAELYAQLAETHDGLLSLDPNARPQIVGTERSGWVRWFERWLPHVDLLRVSDDDLGWIWPEESQERVIEAQLHRGVGVVIVTTAGGATAHTPNGVVSADAPRVEVADTVGAGDSFCGGILVGLHEAGVDTGEALKALTLETWDEILSFAVNVAAVSVTRQGADPPWRRELG